MRPAANDSYRASFISSANSFVKLVSQIPADKWQVPALGVWKVKDLVGHASRALLTIDNYLGKQSGGPKIDDTVAYFIAVRNSGADPDEIARRGIEAGKALGSDPASYVKELADQTLALVSSSKDDTSVGTPWGTMTLADYIPTRTFELTVHSLDLAATLSLPYPEQMGPSIANACELAGRLAGRHPRAIEILFALTGRSEMARDISVL